MLVDSPIGPLGVALDGATVVGVRFGASAGVGRRASGGVRADRATSPAT